jgi:hypothetical protein
MPLYRVVHRSTVGHCGYENTVLADGPGHALNIREAELGIDDDDPGYEVSVAAVPDPDGERARTWEKHFGVPR